MQFHRDLLLQVLFPEDIAGSNSVCVYIIACVLENPSELFSSSCELFFLSYLGTCTSDIRPRNPTSSERCSSLLQIIFIFFLLSHGKHWKVYPGRETQDKVLINFFRFSIQFWIGYLLMELCLEKKKRQRILRFTVKFIIIYNISS